MCSDRPADRSLWRRYHHDQRVQRRKRFAQATAAAICQRDEYERQPDDVDESDEPYDDGNDDDDETIEDGAAATVAEVPEEFMDESNPFYAAKKAQKLQSQKGPAGPAKEEFKDTSEQPATSCGD